MPSALVPLANTTLGASASSVTFSSISGSYRDLMLVLNLTTTTGTASATIRVNSDSGSNYSYVYAAGDGASAVSGSGTTSGVYSAAYSCINSTGIWTGILQFMDYSATNKHKSVLVRANHSAIATEIIANRWANTAAITSISVAASANAFAAGSSFMLYGVSA